MRFPILAAVGVAALIGTAWLSPAQEMAAPKRGRHPGVGKAPDLAGLQAQAKDLEEAVQASQKRKDESVFSAIRLNDLGLVYHELGEYTRAEPLLKKALEIFEKRQGRDPGPYLIGLSNLALLYLDMGDYARAEPLYERAVQAFKKAGREKSSEYADCLNDQASLYADLGDSTQAELLYRRALEIRKQADGEDSLAYAGSLHNLGLLYEDLGEYARAEPLLNQDLEITKKAAGEDSQDYAHSLNTLGFLYKKMGKYPQAEALYDQALKVYQKKVGEEHPAYARTLDNLGYLYKEMGAYDRAEPLLLRALEIRKKVLGENHLETADSLNDLSALYAARGDYGRAVPYLQETLEVIRRNLDLASAVQSERQQLAMAESFRRRLDAYVALAPRAKLPGEQVYQELLLWKGAVFARQRRMRLAQDRSGADPEAARLFDHLQGTSRRLATLIRGGPDPTKPDLWKGQVQELTEEKERLERELAGRSASFRRQQEQDRRTPAQVQKALPPDAALVDFLEYADLPPAGDKKAAEAHLAAFVVRPEKPIIQIDLGPVAPVAKAIDQWLTQLRRTRPILNDQDPAATLRRLLWRPLEPSLEGAKVVLVSPDGVLTRLPLAALPGHKEGSYLIEEVALAVVPVPQLLPDLAGTREGKAGEDRPSLLLVGDVDFGAPPGEADPELSRSAVRGHAGDHQPQWRALPATLGEIAVTERYFKRRFRGGQVEVLEGGDATEASVRQEAPKYRWLHLATHGFFAPQEVRPALGADSRSAGGAGEEVLGRGGVSGFHPGLLSGLVLAGANQPVEPGRDDGILTALEVAALDLKGVELAVLSACDTGRGKLAGGEGVLGLQRAFQVAGAGAVMASLWSVDDEATRKLMERFYENLWQKKLPKLEALREAQIYMLREGLNRGMVVLDEPEQTGKPVSTPPYYWAAFVLSGDWR